MQRAERFKAKSLDCLRAAQAATDATVKTAFLELALQWRELAEHAETLDRERSEP
jgi:hypothetical protein